MNMHGQSSVSWSRHWPSSATAGLQISPHTQRAKGDWTKRQASLDGWVGSFISKRTSRWVARRWVELHTCMPESSVFRETLLGFSQCVPSRWSQQSIVLFKAASWKMVPVVEAVGRTFIPTMGGGSGEWGRKETLIAWAQLKGHLVVLSSPWPSLRTIQGRPGLCRWLIWHVFLGRF